METTTDWQTIDTITEWDGTLVADWMMRKGQNSKQAWVWHSGDTRQSATCSHHHRTAGRAIDCASEMIRVHREAVETLDVDRLARALVAAGMEWITDYPGTIDQIAREYAAPQPVKENR